MANDGVGAGSPVHDVCDYWQRRRRVKIVLFLQYSNYGRKLALYGVGGFLSCDSYMKKGI
jgi:hypothetical protein